MPKVDGNSVQRWQKYDQQTVTKKDASGAQEIDHGASSVANLKEAGKNLANTFDPTNHFRDSWRNAGRGDLPGIGYGIAVLMLPWDAGREVVDLVSGPLKMAKNVGDAAVHAAMAGINKLF